jgi:hypothetical protein
MLSLPAWSKSLSGFQMASVGVSNPSLSHDGNMPQLPLVPKYCRPLLQVHAYHWNRTGFSISVHNSHYFQDLIRSRFCLAPPGGWVGADSRGFCQAKQVGSTCGHPHPP